MADNVNIKDFAGMVATVLTDEVIGSAFGAGQVQVFKQMDGTAGGTNLAIVNAAGAALSATADGAGALINSLTAGAGQNGLMTALGATNFVSSAGNSTTAQLLGGATFTGTIESIFNQQDISLLLTSDQSGTLIMRQYIDSGGTRVTSTWTFFVVAGVPYSRSFVGNGNFFNLTFQNTAATLTTTLNINTAYGTLSSSTNQGNHPVSLAESSVVSVVNSSVTNLAAAAVFTGAAEDILEYAEVRVFVYSSHASAVDGLSLQQSVDGTTWFQTDTWTIGAATAKTFGIGASARYFRVVYTNGATATTTLQLQTIFHKHATKPTAQRPSDGYTNEFDGEQQISYQMVYNGTTWDRQLGSAGSMNVRQPDATASASLAAAAATATLAVNGASGTAIQITGTFVATLQFEGTVDGTNWVSLFSTPNGTATTVTSATAVGMWLAKSGGFSQIRVRASAYTSGTAVVTIRAGQGTGNVTIDTPVRLNQTRALSDSQGTTCTTVAATSVLAAGGAGVFHDLANITIINGAATATVATLSDGTKTYLYPLAAAIGSGCVISLPTPRKATTANVAWTVALSVASTVQVHLDYVKNS